MSEARKRQSTTNLGDLSSDEDLSEKISEKIIHRFKRVAIDFEGLLKKYTQSKSQPADLDTGPPMVNIGKSTPDTEGQGQQGNTNNSNSQSSSHGPRNTDSYMSYANVPPLERDGIRPTLSAIRLTSTPFQDSIQELDTFVAAKEAKDGSRSRTRRSRSDPHKEQLYKDRVEKLADENEQLKQRVRKLEDELEAAQKEIAAKKPVDEENDQLKQRVRKLQDDLDATKKELNEQKVECGIFRNDKAVADQSLTRLCTELEDYSKALKESQDEVGRLKRQVHTLEIQRDRAVACNKELAKRNTVLKEEIDKLKEKQKFPAWKANPPFTRATEKNPTK